MSNSNITIKDTYTVAEVVEISGLSISKIRSLIKSGDLIAETVNTTNDTGRKIRRTEIKLQDLIDFGMVHPSMKPCTKQSAKSKFPLMHPSSVSPALSTRTPMLRLPTSMWNPSRKWILPMPRFVVSPLWSPSIT